LDASKCGSTQQHTSTMKSVENPSNNKIHNLALVALTTCQQLNQLQLSFINVNTKPEGEIGCQQTWVDTTADCCKMSCLEPKRQQNPQLGACCSHHMPAAKSTSAKLYKCKHKARRRLDASARVNTTADQRYEINHQACRGSNLWSLMAERFRNEFRVLSKSL
jgi:hypothetical protein